MTSLQFVFVGLLLMAHHSDWPHVDDAPTTPARRHTPPQHTYSTARQGEEAPKEGEDSSFARSVSPLSLTSRHLQHLVPVTRLLFPSFFVLVFMS